MKLPLEVDVNDAIFADNVKAAVAAFFSAPGYGNTQGGYGYESIKREVHNTLKNMEYEALIQDAWKRLVPELVEQLTERAIRNMITEQLKYMKSKGLLNV
jgi:hypothetical protein